MMTFGQWLRGIMDRPGFEFNTPRKLSIATGINLQTVYDMLGDKYKRPREETLDLLWPILGVTRNEIMLAARYSVPLPEHDPTYQEFLRISKCLTPQQRIAVTNMLRTFIPNPGVKSEIEAIEIFNDPFDVIEKGLQFDANINQGKGKEEYEESGKPKAVSE